MTLLGALRPDEWNLPLFLHVLGAFMLVGALTMAAGFLFRGRRDGSIAMIRLGFRSLLYAALPSYIVLRVAAQWIAAEQGVDDADLAWINVGYISTDAGLLFLLTATISTGLVVRRATAEHDSAGGRWMGVASWLVAALVAVYLVAIWVMATKPA